MDLGWLKTKIRQNQYLFTLHADEERRNDSFAIEDVEKALLEGQILETYPNDPRGSSCLVYGESKGVPVHVVCGRNSEEWLVIITVYRPTFPKWKTPTKRS